MSERPDAAELLALARAALLDEIADAVPAEKRYTVLMAANAIAIAGREIAAGARMARETLAALAGLYGEVAAGEEEDAETVEARLAGLERRLARDLRRGAFDGDPRLPALLLRRTRAALAISNPKALPAEHSGREGEVVGDGTACGAPPRAPSPAPGRG
ncbi:MAG: hypothetical protein IRY94_03025 [Rhodospirillaceae bacterium]|nr:hypothetical protein [Rhodospirillaceae bacterium]